MDVFVCESPSPASLYHLCVYSAAAHFLGAKERAPGPEVAVVISCRLAVSNIDGRRTLRERTLGADTEHKTSSPEKGGKIQERL